MLNDTPLVNIDLSPEYKRNLRDLSKRYRNIRSDTQDVIQQIQSGNFVGDRIAGLGEDYVVIKVRVKNSNIQKGKSAGYRLVYQVESAVSVLLLTITRKAIAMILVQWKSWIFCLLLLMMSRRSRREDWCEKNRCY